MFTYEIDNGESVVSDRPHEPTVEISQLEYDLLRSVAQHAEESHALARRYRFLKRFGYKLILTPTVLGVCEVLYKLPDGAIMGVWGNTLDETIDRATAHVEEAVAAIVRNESQASVLTIQREGVL